MAKSQPNLGSVAQAADLLGVSTQTVRRYIEQGRLSAYRIGPRIVKINLDELGGLVHKIPSARDSLR